MSRNHILIAEKVHLYPRPISNKFKISWQLNILRSHFSAFTNAKPFATKKSDL